MMLMDELQLCAHCLRAVVAPELALVPYGAGGSSWIKLRVSLRRQRLEIAIGGWLFRRPAGRLVEPVIFIRNAGPAFAVKRHTEDDFARGYAGSKKVHHCVRAIVHVQRRL